MGPDQPRTCPTCGLPTESRGEDGEWQPNCNPIRSPECWSLIAKLPKIGSVEREVAKRAKVKGRG